MIDVTIGRRDDLDGGLLKHHLHGSAYLGTFCMAHS